LQSNNPILTTLFFFFFFFHEHAWIACILLRGKLPYASVTVDAPSKTPVTTAGEEPEEFEDDEMVTGSVLQKGDRVPGMLDWVARSRRPNPRMIGPE